METRAGHVAISDFHAAMDLGDGQSPLRELRKPDSPECPCAR